MRMRIHTRSCSTCPSHLHIRLIVSRKAEKHNVLQGKCPEDIERILSACFNTIATIMTTSSERHNPPTYNQLLKTQKAKPKMFFCEMESLLNARVYTRVSQQAVCLPHKLLQPGMNSQSVHFITCIAAHQSLRFFRRSLPLCQPH